MSRLQQGYLFDSRYKLLKKLGEGGFSEVWLVEDTSAQLTLVLKVFLPTAQLDESGIEMFRQEFALVYNLNHPNLLKYTYFGVCVGHPYLVMPYYNSGSAEDLLGNCSERKAWQFLHDVSSGLACMHEHQPPIIHQDIKPANVLLDGNSYIITDFGISSNVKHMLGESAEGKSTVQGTRPYMPPEKFQRNQMPLVASDIWALGASLYEMLTGRLPFGGKGGEAQLAGEEVPPLPANYSDDLKEVIMQCLAPVPGNRPFATDLERFAAEHLAQISYTPSSIHTSNGPYNSSSIHISGQYPANSSSHAQSPKSKKLPVKGIIIGACVAVVVLLVVLFSLRGKKSHQAYDEAMGFYQRGVQTYQQGMDNTQGQLERFKHALVLFDSAQACQNTEFQEVYTDSINIIRGNIHDYCLAEAKENLPGAFLENGLRENVLNYLKLAKLINDDSEVNTLIDSIQYIYIPED